jgi:enoyl-CoA hydratase
MVREEELHEEALAMARHMAELPPLALKWTKLSIRKGAESGLEDTFRAEGLLNGICYASEDHREATSAFFEKRKPVFKGR